jgi:hypothetical protein
MSWKVDDTIKRSIVINSIIIIGLINNYWVIYLLFVYNILENSIFNILLVIIVASIFSIILILQIIFFYRNMIKVQFTKDMICNEFNERSATLEKRIRNKISKQNITFVEDRNYGQLPDRNLPNFAKFIDAIISIDNSDITITIGKTIELGNEWCTKVYIGPLSDKNEDIIKNITMNMDLD